ncbi:putative uncharacterized protein [Prevotella sp. CAG:732]|nr:putative uncharacterized protein [Prevotella sp. CAG:732]
MKQLEMLKKAMAGKGLPYGWTYCFNEQCVVKDECVRFLSTRFLSEKRHSGNAVFPSAWRNGNCQYYEKLRIAKLAWGFDHLYRNVTLKDAPTLRCRLRGYLGSKGQYYRYKLGQLLLLPKQQLEIKELFHSYGYDDVEFDHFKETFVSYQPDFPQAHSDEASSQLEDSISERDDANSQSEKNLAECDLFYWGV